MKPKYLTFFLFVLSLILIITSQSVISIELMDNLYKDKTVREATLVNFSDLEDLEKKEAAE